MKITATRYHDFSCGHRVVGHEGRCALLHGHNYRVHFTVEANELDAVNRVIDFSVIKELLCDWLERHWDHKFLAWERDTLMQQLMGLSKASADKLFIVNETQTLERSIVWLPFNPTAEGIAMYLLNEVGPSMLPSRCRLVRVVVEETRKCSAEARLPGDGKL